MKDRKTWFGLLPEKTALSESLKERRIQIDKELNPRRKKSITISLSTALVMMIILLFAGTVAFADTVKLPAELQTIEEYAFYGDEKLSEVVLPEKLESIGNMAFAQSSVSRIYLPASISFIDDTAFDGCTGLVGYGPDNTVASRFFDRAPNLVFERQISPLADFTFEAIDGQSCKLVGYQGTDSAVVIPEENADGLSVTTIGMQAFQNSSIVSVVVPQTVKTIEESAFFNCNRLKEVTLPEGIETIGIQAFYLCRSLEKIEIPDTVTTMGAVCFGGCFSLKELHYPKSLASSRETFNGSNLTTIEVPEGVESIPSCTFMGCTSLVSISLPSTLKTIGSSAFQGCTGLVSIDIPSGVTEVPDSAFDGCSSLSYVDLKDSVVKLGIRAFADCIALESIRLPDSITTLDQDAFLGCSSLKKVNYPVHLQEALEPFRECEKLTDMVIPNGVEEIPEYLFWGMNHLKTVTLPNTLKKLDGFEACTALTCITIPESVAEIEPFAFRGCSSLSFVEFSEGLVTIGEQAFGGCTSLKDITLPDSVTNIRDHAFEGDTSVTSLKIPYNWQYSEWTYSPFEGCTQLKSVAFPEGFTNIPGSAFANVNSLKSVYIPDSVVTIGNNAFYGCSEDLVIYCAPGSTAQQYATEQNIQYNNGAFPQSPVESPEILDYTLPNNSIRTGEEAEFTVTVSHADTLTLIVDGVAYDTVPVAEDHAVIRRAFTMGGLREIAFRANRAGAESAVEEAGLLFVESDDRLDEPVITLKGSYNLGADLTASWTAVNHAEQYVIYTYFNGGAVDKYVMDKSEAADGVFSFRLKPDMLAWAGNYGVEVIATAHGYSQRSGTVLFTLNPFDEYDAYLESSPASIFMDPDLNQVAGELTQNQEQPCVRVLYEDNDVALVRYTTDGEEQQGWLAADRLTRKAPVRESKLSNAKYTRNVRDPDADVIIRITATKDMNKIAVIVNGEKVYHSPDETKPDGENQSRYTIHIGAVKTATEFEIQGLYEDQAGSTGEILRNTTSINVNPVLDTPEIGDYADCKAGEDLELTWTGSTSSTSYALSLRKDKNSSDLWSKTVTAENGKDTYTDTIPGSFLQEGSYVIRIVAKDASTGRESAPALKEITVTEKDCWYLQQEYWSKANSYARISFQDQIEIVEQNTQYRTETGKFETQYHLKYKNRSGDILELREVWKSEITLAKTRYIPETAPVFQNKDKISISGLSVGTEAPIKVTTNRAVDQVELYVDNKFSGNLKLARESLYDAMWEAKWTVPDESKHSITVRLIAANGATDKFTFDHIGVCDHEPDLKNTVFEKQITDKGIRIQSGICQKCDHRLDGYVMPPHKLYPNKIAGYSNNMLIINGSLNDPSLQINLNRIGIQVTGAADVTIHSLVTNGNVSVLSSRLQANRVSCNELEVRGKFHAGQVSAEKVCIAGSGELSMKDGDTLVTTRFDFSSGRAHSSLLTGGVMTIRGDMSTNAPFGVGENHKTVFTGGNKHLLNNSSRIAFGILQCECALGDLGAKKGFTYQYLLLPPVDENQHTAPTPPELPESVRPYLDGRGKMKKESLENQIRTETYREEFEQKKVSFRFEDNRKFFTGKFFTINKLTDQKSLEDSLETHILEEAALNALMESAASFEGSIISLGVREIDYTERLFYDVPKGDTMLRIRYYAYVHGTASGIAGSALGMMTIAYTEWIDGSEESVTNTFSVVPTDSFSEKTVSQIMRTLRWEGQQYAEKTIEELREEIWKDYVASSISSAEFEKVSNVTEIISQIDGIAEMTSSQKENKPLLQVGSMRVYNDQLTGSIPFSDLCQTSYDLVSS